MKRAKRPNKQLPFDLKQFQAKIPDLGRSVCAIIEFESAQAAKFAVETLKFRTQELKFRLALLEPGVSNNFCVGKTRGQYVIYFMVFWEQEYGFRHFLSLPFHFPNRSLLIGR